MLKLTFDKRRDLEKERKKKNQEGSGRREEIRRKQRERRGDARKQMLKTEIERGKEEEKNRGRDGRRKSSLVHLSMIHH